MAEIACSWQEYEQRYQVYLLRCWKEEVPGSEEESNSSPNWRFMLVKLDQDQEIKGFACLEKLLIHLRGEFQEEELIPVENAPISQSSSKSQGEK